ncbi:MAG TPA: HEAT repeat domain-containing protein, partial [Candidatus Binatia bacterium]|nr:HEAT repeat domain-containing protein [Candidatus Binatia bacterium]
MQQHAEFLGLMDSAMRRRFNPFADEGLDLMLGISEQREKETKRGVKPDELLRRRAKAIVTGAPGCGKTTLLKYLALRAQEKEARLAVWLELKLIDKPLFVQAEQAAVSNGTLILQELWLKHTENEAQLSLSDAEIKLLREHWQNKFKANEIAVLLDGFDELQDEVIERSLNKCVREFTSAVHDNLLLISTRPYAQHKLGNEHLQELEIEPLDERQIEAFLNCYYPNDAAIKRLLKTLRERSSVGELLHLPLLLGVILRLHRERRYTDNRPNLCETIISDLVHKLDRSKSVIRHFKINDRRLRSDFLKFLAFERLLRDLLDEEQEANRIVFSYDLLKEKAQAFLTQERLSHNARDLANDVLATPLLREVGADTFAFTHLTLQEYLAASAFAAFYKSNESEGLKIFCRAYHKPTIVEMEVLPMMLGELSNADKLYAQIECWPESLTFANFRLRLRGLVYGARISEDRLLKTTGRVLEFLTKSTPEESTYHVPLARSLTGIDGHYAEAVINRIVSLLEDENCHDRWPAMWMLGRIGRVGRIRSDRAVNALIKLLSDKDHFVRGNAVEILGKIGDQRAFNALVKILKSDEDRFVRGYAAEALGEIGNVKAVDDLIEAFM